MRRRLMRGSGGFTASPWAYNGKVFALSEDGDTYVLDSAKGFEVVGTNSLDETAMSTPGDRARQPLHPHPFASVAVDRSEAGRAPTGK